MSYIGKIPANAVLTTADLADGIVTAAKIEDGTVVAAEIASNAITTAKINADAVTGAKIADDAINSEHYTDGSIDTAHIADVNVTQGKIADQAINEAKIQISNAPTNGYMLTAQSGNTGGMTWAEAGGGDMVKLSTSTISANTTAVTFNGLFSSTYKNYFVIGSSIRPDASTSIYMRFRVSDSDVTASNYIWTQNTIRVQNSNGAMEEDNNSSKSAFFKLAPTLSPSNNTDGNAAKRAYNFNFHLHDPLSTSYAKYFFGATASIYDNGSDTWFYNHHIAGTYSASSAALTGFTIYPSAGNFDAGTITLYGLKH